MGWLGSLAFRNKILNSKSIVDLLGYSCTRHTMWLATYCCIHTDAAINDEWRLLYKYMCTSHFICKGSKRVTQGLRVRGSWRPNRNCYILTPTLMAVNVVSFLFSWCSTGGPEAHSAGWWLSLLHLISIFSGRQFNQGPRAPSAWCGFPYHISITPSDL